MKHLFIINPAAAKVKGRVDAIRNDIETFFRKHPRISYDIYVSSWCRDAVAYIRRYIVKDNSPQPEAVRIHAVGGSGTLFEVVNGAIGFDHVEIAAFPYGGANVFLRYFGSDKQKLFASMDSHVFDKAVPMDVIHCGNNYGISYGIVGFEAACALRSLRLRDYGLPSDLSHLISALPALLLEKNICHDYKITIDGQNYDGRYLSLLIANSPCYGERFSPAADAHPNDGLLDIYLIREHPRRTYLFTTADYLKGNHAKLHTLLHCRGTSISVSADETMVMNIDSETFYNTYADFRLLPAAIQFVCPEQINLSALPRVYSQKRR